MSRYYPQTVLRTAAIGLELAPQASRTNPPPRILIIEDELLVALIIEEMCRGAGYRVSGVAHTVETAWMNLRSEILMPSFLTSIWVDNTSPRLQTF